MDTWVDALWTRAREIASIGHGLGRLRIAPERLRKRVMVRANTVGNTGRTGPHGSAQGRTGAHRGAQARTGAHGSHRVRTGAHGFFFSARPFHGLHGSAQKNMVTQTCRNPDRLMNSWPCWSRSSSDVRPEWPDRFSTPVWTIVVTGPMSGMLAGTS